MTKDRLRKTKEPCPLCFLHLDLCICEFIPKLNLKTRVSLVVHYKELKRTTNTGRLAIAALSNSEMLVRGEIQIEDPKALDLSTLIMPNYESVLFYPSTDAIELSPEWVAAQKKPIHLIVPDGNWRQASKVHYRHPELKELNRVKITPKCQATQWMRKETVEGGMATLEAIARALEILEGREVGGSLLNLYQLKLERTLASRGLVSKNKIE
jgi:DTW domain-containing protein YfiP